MKSQENKPISAKLQKQLLALSEDIEFALLFGSYASHNASILSDIDIGICFANEPDLLAIGLIITKLETETGKKIDLIILNHLSFKRPLLSYNITKNHIPIIINSQKKYGDFKTNSLYGYLDFKPILDAQSKALDERISHGTYGKIQTA